MIVCFRAEDETALRSVPFLSTCLARSVERGGYISPPRRVVPSPPMTRYFMRHVPSATQRRRNQSSYYAFALDERLACCRNDGDFAIQNSAQLTRNHPFILNNINQLATVTHPLPLLGAEAFVGVNVGSF